MEKGLRRSIALTVVLCLALLVVATYASRASAQALPKINWDIPHYNSTGHFLILRLQEWGDEVKKRTNGNFTITVHPGESLMKGKQIAPALLAGRVPLGPAQVGYADDIFVLHSITNLPFLTTTTEEIRQIAAREYRDYFAKLLDEMGLKMLMAFAHAPIQSYTRSERMDTADAWKAKKIRIFTSMMADTVVALKGVPMNITYSEVYTALQRATIDGYFTSNANLPFNKFYEVSKFVNMWGYSGGNMEYMCVNKEAYKKLPQEYQKALVDVIQDLKIEDKIWSDLIKNEDESIEFLKTKGGMTILYPSKAESEKVREATLPIWDKWAKTYENRGAKELLEKIKSSIAAYRKR
jgi:TRAP-type C4-dicarboxylate transport system substrate-binding protein